MAMARACSTLAAQFCTPRGGCRITDPICRIPLSTPPDTMCLSRPGRAKTRRYNIQERGSNIQDSPFHPSCYDVFIPTGECENKSRSNLQDRGSYIQEPPVHPYRHDFFVRTGQCERTPIQDSRSKIQRPGRPERLGPPFPPGLQSWRSSTTRYTWRYSKCSGRSHAQL